MLKGKSVQLTAFSFLYRRALNTAIRTINTAISLFAFKFIFAVRTFPKILTIISWHLFNSFSITFRTGDCRLELKISHEASFIFLGFTLQTFEIIIGFFLKHLRTMRTSTKKHFPSCNFHTYSLL